MRPNETRRALVTGASEGIGRATARALAAAGYTVTMLARNEARLRELLHELPGADHELLVADLASAGGVQCAVDALARERYTLLVNNAAFGAVGAFESVPLERQIEMIRVNVEAVVSLAHAFLSRACAGDCVVNVSSVVARLSQPSQPVYTATKAFVTSFSESLWQACRGRGVHVLALHPGATLTCFGERAGRDPRKPRPRLLTQQPEEVAAELLAAIERARGPVVISGRVNRAIDLIAGALPRRWLLRAAGRAAR